MKKRILACAMALCMVCALCACGEKNAADPGVSSTPSKPDASSEVSTEPEEVSKPEETPQPKPYCEENQIVFEKLENMDIPFPLEATRNGEIFKHEGISFENKNSHYTFGEITCSPSQQTGYLDIVIPYQVSVSTTFYQDVSKFGDPIDGFSFNYFFFDVGDYYTGLKVPMQPAPLERDQTITSNAEKEYEWNGNTYSIACTLSGTYSRENAKWSRNGNIVQTPYITTVDQVMTITVPENYDGTVLRIERAVTELPSDEDESEEEKDTYLLDEHGADYYHYYRLSDILEAAQAAS